MVANTVLYAKSLSVFIHNFKHTEWTRGAQFHANFSILVPLVSLRSSSTISFVLGIQP